MLEGTVLEKDKAFYGLIIDCNGWMLYVQGLECFEGSGQMVQMRIFDQIKSGDPVVFYYQDGRASNIQPRELYIYNRENLHFFHKNY